MDKISKDEEDYSYRELTIPKKNGKVRKIVAPNKHLLAYQRKKLPKIENTYLNLVKNTYIENCANGFIKGRNGVSAARQHVGFDLTVILDIKDFFDYVTDKMIQREVDFWGELPHLYHAKGKYAAQGFATSPILANISSIQLLKDIDKFLAMNYSRKDFVHTIYADDIHISVNLQHEDYKDENQIKEQVALLIEKNGFIVNRNKTRARYAKHGFRRILGVNVGNSINEGNKGIFPSRKTNRKIRAARHQKNGSSLGGLVTWSKCLPPKKQR